MAKLCNSCGKLPRVNALEVLCKSCYDQKVNELESHYAAVKSKQDEELECEAEERWTQFIATHTHLSEYIKFDINTIKRFPCIREVKEYISKYSTVNSNQGVGLAFIGDHANKGRMLGLYTLKRIMVKHFKYDYGIVAFDYAHMSDCISNVFGSPSDNFYSSSGLLLMDSVDLQAIIDNKHELKAFTAFLKYRMDHHRPTFLVMTSAVSQLPKQLSTYFEQAFAHRPLLT